MVSEFLRLPTEIGVEGIEACNDILGEEITDSAPSWDPAPRIADLGLEVASVTALQRFSDWTTEFEAEALDAYREIVPTLFRKLRDPTCFVHRELNFLPGLARRWRLNEGSPLSLFDLSEESNTYAVRARIA